MSSLFKNFQRPMLTFLGFFVALFSAGVGIGGGTIFVSTFISVFKFEFKQAAATSLATIIPITFIGAVSQVFIFSNAPSFKYFMVFTPMCVIGTIIGSKYIHKLSSRRLKYIFAIFLLITSFRIIKLIDFPFLMFSTLNEISWAHEAIFIMIFGIIIGITASWLGVGCGLLIVPFFIIVMDFNMHNAICLSVTTMFFLSTSATLVHSKFKNMDFKIFKSLFLPSLVGAAIGSAISGLLPSFFLKQFFAVILMIAALAYLLEPTLKQIKILFKKRTSIKET